MTLLSIQNMTKRFGGLVALNALNINVKEKSIHSIIGPNGAGKTTFFNCLTGFYRPEEGEVLLSGNSIVGLSPDRIVHKGIARTYQNIRLFPNLTALENVMVGYHVHLKSSFIGPILGLKSTKMEEAKAKQIAMDLLKYVKMEGKENTLAKNFPYGEQRRLEMARALASQPKLLLLDEPTAGMNPRETQDMMDFIEHMRGEIGITIVLIEHQMRVVMNISDIVTVFDYGKMIAEGLPEEIKNNKTVIEAYLGSGDAADSH
ncbi:MAG: ABC transporter ATP-binding protein [Desulfobacterales bacterium RIFOXYA12_FULL_46_15]|nr:MAG: ABC transporter ATP-binding protein [Desulfobacula sp. GWF2_41_7]OGR23912.1 MAG: ABC transporter ATP-binding protein [Desulfobacterales bacterium RIFOXYA12_FULL_46_15]